MQQTAQTGAPARAAYRYVIDLREYANVITAQLKHDGAVVADRTLFKNQDIPGQACVEGQALSELDRALWAEGVHAARLGDAPVEWCDRGYCEVPVRGCGDTWHQWYGYVSW